MTHRRILLTGAGFTKNWGGYLACEVWERLLSHPLIREQPVLRKYLLQRPKYYETALFEVRRDGVDPSSSFERALYDVFLEQHGAHAGGVGHDYRPLWLPLLESFRDSSGTSQLFTLNQDLFLETTYHPASGGLLAPGIGRIDGLDEQSVLTARQAVTNQRVDVATGHVNYVKLHGSFNWRTSEGNVMLLAGEGKREQLPGFPLLEHYLGLFERACSEPDSCLIVVGYAFGDPHINEAILDGVTKVGLRVRVINIEPPDCLRKRLMSQPHAEIWEALDGYCSLPLPTLLTGHAALSALIPGWEGSR
jgi:hypothetical protein